MSLLSYLEKLLDGADVEWKSLDSIFDIFAGGDVPKDALSDIETNEFNIPILSNGIGDKSIYGWTNTAKINLPSLTISARGTIGWTNIIQRPFFPIVRLLVLTPKVELNLKYAYHYMKLIENNYKVPPAGIPQLTKPMLKDICVPIPCPNNPEKSLAIQSEIVRILDAFTAMTAELTAELNMRKKQYNYYRDQLLSFEEDDVEWKTLLEACDYVDYRGKTPPKTTSGIFLVTAKNIRMGYIDYEASQEFIDEDDYSVVMRRGIPKLGDVLITTEAPCGFVAQVDRGNIALAQRVIKYRSKDSRLSNSFLKHYLLSGHFQKKLHSAATGSTVKGIKGSKLHQLTIPIPSEAEQDRIVSILDKFDTLTTSIKEGLPREIELRQKQYEYYRDLLLSFPRSEVVAA